MWAGRGEQQQNVEIGVDLLTHRAGIAYMLWYVTTKMPEVGGPGAMEEARGLALAHHRWKEHSCSSS